MTLYIWVLYGTQLFRDGNWLTLSVFFQKFNLEKVFCELVKMRFFLDPYRMDGSNFFVSPETRLAQKRVRFQITYRMFLRGYVFVFHAHFQQRQKKYILSNSVFYLTPTQYVPIVRSLLVASFKRPIKPPIIDRYKLFYYSRAILDWEGSHIFRRDSTTKNYINLKANGLFETIYIFSR